MNMEVAMFFMVLGTLIIARMITSFFNNDKVHWKEIFSGEGSDCIYGADSDSGCDCGCDCGSDCDCDCH